MPLCPWGPQGPKGNQMILCCQTPGDPRAPRGTTKRDTFDFMGMCFTVKVSRIAQLLWGPPRTYRAPRGKGGL